MNLKQEVGGLIGADRVSDDPEVIAALAGDMSFVPSRSPDLLAKPKGAKDIQGIVAWANQANVPLVPVSSGAPHSRGDTVPSVGGVVVDLSGMNEILRINRKNRVAVIETGVTFSQLIPELKKEGLRLNLPLAPRANKSVLASGLEREPVIIPRHHWDAADPLLCLEVVFGTGEVFQTGEASGPGGLQGQWQIGGAQKFPLGPHQVDYHKLIQGAQGTIGIATWASIKCELYPVIDKLYFLSDTRLERLIEVAYRLIRLDLGDEVFLLNNFTLASLLAPNREGIDKLVRTLPPWILVFTVCGYNRHPEEKVDYQEKDLFEITQKEGLTPGQSLGEVKAEVLLRVIRNASPEPYWKLRYGGENYELFFITTLNRVESFIPALREMAVQENYPASQIGIYIQPVVQGTSCHLGFDFPCPQGDAREKARIRGLIEKASLAFQKQGAFFSRPYGSWAQMVYSQNTEFVNAMKRVKGVFDPKNILNPGKLCF
ncbi:MAG: FAD-binding oxidoreductase [Proteobacteria bacterium]|nr:FAD-binding oxidoreductase [Pseudomonadota bacterium]